MVSEQLFLANLELIKNTVDKLKVGEYPKNPAVEFFQQSSLVNLEATSKKAFRKKPLTAKQYLEMLDTLFNNYYKHNGNAFESRVIDEIKIAYLKKIIAVLQKAIEAAKVRQFSADDTSKFYNAIFHIEAAIQQSFSPDFKLVRPLNLSAIAWEYDEAYKNQYGKQCFSFFKLPLKQFFRKSTRDAEIKFLEKIHFCCEKSTLFTEEQQKYIKLSALNLVSLKISSETFGSNSLLSKILQKRIDNSGLNNDAHLMVDLVEVCKKARIEIPPHLQHFYENDIEFNDYQESAAPGVS